MNAALYPILFGSGGVQRLKLVGTLDNVPIGSQNLTGTALQQVTRYPVYIGKNCSSFQFIFDNFYVTAATTGGAVTPAAGAVTIGKFAIENAAASLSIPITFSGSRPKVLAAGDYEALTDEIKIPPGFVGRDGLIFIRFTGTAATTGLTPIRRFMQIGTTTMAAVSWIYDPVNDIDQVDGTGALTKPTGAVAPTLADACFGPSYILGRQIGNKVPSIICVGDSIVTQNDDTFNPNPVACGLAFVGRAQNSNPVNGSAISKLIPIAKTSIASATIHSTFNFAGTPSAKMLYALKYADCMIQELATNDVGQTFATTYAEVQALWALGRAAGITKIIQNYLFPRTGGTWHATDGSDQTYTGYQAPGGKHDLLNQQYDADLAAGNIHAIVKHTGIRHPNDFFKWISPSPTEIGSDATADGVHPYRRTHVPSAIELRTAMVGLYPAAA